MFQGRSNTVRNHACFDPSHFIDSLNMILCRVNFKPKDDTKKDQGRQDDHDDDVCQNFFLDLVSFSFQIGGIKHDSCQIHDDRTY